MKYSSTNILGIVVIALVCFALGVVSEHLSIPEILVAAVTIGILTGAVLRLLHRRSH